MTFALPGLPKSDIPTQYNQKFFETLTLPFTLHNITVTHGGDPSVTSLVLGSLVVMNGTTSKTLPAQISSPFNRNHAKHARKLGIIIGPVFATVVIFIIVSAGVIIYLGGKNWERTMTPSYRCHPLRQAISLRQTIHGTPTMCACQTESTPFMSTAGLESPSRTSSTTLRHSNTITRTMQKQKGAVTAFNLSPGSESGSSRFVLHRDSGVRMTDTKVVPSHTPS